MPGQNARTVSLIILTIIAVSFVLYMLKPLLIPFLIAVMLTYILSPIVEKLNEYYRIPRLITLLVVFIIGFAIVGNLVEVLIANIIAFTGNFSGYSTQLSALLERYSSAYPWMNNMVQNVTTLLFNLPLGTFANTILNSSVNFISNTVLIVLFIAYLCLSIHTYPGKIERAFPDHKGKQIMKILSRISDDIKQYISIHTFISVAIGVSTGIICWIFGVPFAFLWGFLAFILNYIPTIGPIIAAVPPVITAFVDLEPSSAIWFSLVLLLVQAVFTNVVEPKVAGDRLGISPLMILLSLIFWFWLWGIVGAILAVPIASIIKITCENIGPLRPISVLMDDE